MAKLTVNQAARAGYAARATIYRKIKIGTLPVESGDNDQAVIDTEDLERVFGEPDPQRETSPDSTSDMVETVRLRTENALLRAENADLRLHRDRLMALLEQAALPAAAAGAGRSLRRLLGRRPSAQEPR